MLGSVMDRISQTLLVDRPRNFVENAMQTRGRCALPLHGCAAFRILGSLGFLEPARPEFARGALFLSRPVRQETSSDSVRRTLEQLDLNYFVPCRISRSTPWRCSASARQLMGFSVERRRRTGRDDCRVCCCRSGQRAASTARSNKKRSKSHALKDFSDKHR